MKAEGGGLIYIIISIVFLIISAYQKNKKKREQAAHPAEGGEESTHPTPGWQKELEDIFGPVDPVPEVVSVPSTRYDDNKPVATTIAEHERVERITPKEGKIATNTDHRIMKDFPADLTVQEGHEIANIDLDEFELEKAVIYSEILNRKYF